MRVDRISPAAMALAIATVLAGCGQMPDEGAGIGNPVAEEAGADDVVIAFATPDAAEGGGGDSATPEIVAIEAQGIEVAIKDGKLTPSTVEAQPGNPVVMTVTGDGKEHTLEIKSLVDPMTIAASGQTNVEFVAAEEPGTFEILIDGKPGGEFKSMSADGAS